MSILERAEVGERIKGNWISSEEKKTIEKMAVTLNNGFKMPKVGLGVWRMEGKDVRDLIINAIKIGYRHFDCAGKFPIYHLMELYLFFHFLFLVKF